MEFKEQLPVWKAEGVKPPQTHLDEGWQVGDRPPAAWFNWLQNRTFKSLMELREACIQLGYDIENIDFSTVDSAISDIKRQLALKVDKEVGKGLSTYDFDDYYRNKVLEINSKADKTYVDSELKKVVRSVNGKKGDVTLEATDIEFSTGWSLHNEIQRKAFRSELPGTLNDLHVSDSWKVPAGDVLLSLQSQKADKSELKDVEEKLFQSGVESNKILVDALNSKEVKASTSDTIRTNVKKVNDIKQGAQVPLEPITNLTGLDTGSRSVKLTWSSPKDIVVNDVTVTEFDYDILVRSHVSTPQTPEGGVTVAKASRDEFKYVAFEDKDVDYNRVYYYTVFSVSKNNIITKGNSVDIDVERGTPLRSLPVGAKIKDPNSKYYGEPIVWMKLEDNHYGMDETTLLSEQILCLKAFDAKEPRDPHVTYSTTRRTNGNNSYIHSNIRQWLNSSKSDWYTPQHEADEPPTQTYTRLNPYMSEEGFMTNLSPELKSEVLTTNLKVVQNYREGGGMTEFTDKIFLLSATELGVSNMTKYVEGAQFDYFETASDRLATPTRGCVERDDGDSSGFTYNESWDWWSRTPHYGSQDYQQSQVISAQNDWRGAVSGDGGVRPALNLDSSVTVLQEPDSDGVYILNI